MFVLCIEKLFQLINLEVEGGRWKPVKITRGGPSLSYLALADDVILFAEASEDQVLLIKNTFDLFCSCSGQKSVIVDQGFFSPRI